jgi:2-phosphoglycerate kinase
VNPTDPDQASAPLVVLLGGSPGVGKTSLAIPLAARLGLPLTFVDDVSTALERMTDPERYPVLHMWRLHPEDVLALDDAGKLAHTQEYGAVMAEALEPVIADHLESSTPVLLEGDFLLPSLAVAPAFGGVPADGRVRGIWLAEDADQLERNMVAREGEEMAGYAPISWRYGEWLREECARLGLPTIPARPWDTVVDRAVASLMQGVSHTRQP